MKTVQQENWSVDTFLEELLAQEIEGRRQRRLQRLLRSSHLPASKTLASFEQKHLSLRLLRHLSQLCNSEFVNRAENLLVLDLPG